MAEVLYRTAGRGDFVELSRGVRGDLWIEAGYIYEPSILLHLTDEQAEQLERALYLYRITKPFNERPKEDTS